LYLIRNNVFFFEKDVIGLIFFKFTMQYRKTKCDRDVDENDNKYIINIIFHRARDFFLTNFPEQFFRPRCNKRKLIILGRCIAAENECLEKIGGYPDDVTERTYKRAIFYYYANVDTSQERTLLRRNAPRKCIGRCSGDWSGSFLYFCQPCSNYTFQGCHR